MYVKLFSSIFQGTLRGNSHGLLVFTNLLAHTGTDSLVDIHPRAIAEEVGLTLEEVKAALLVLESPDEESRSAEEDGRRIVRIDEHRAWGWRVVNYAKYRAIRNEDDRREQNRAAQERFRNKHSAKLNGHQQPSATVSQGQPRKPKSAQAEAEGEAEEEATTPPSGGAPTVTDAGALCLALKAAGICKVNPGHQRLKALLEAGATVGEFLAHVEKAMEKGNDAFVYLLAIVEGERKRAAATVGKLHKGPLPEYESPKEAAARRRMEEIAPGVAAKRPKPQQETIDVIATRIA